MNWCILIPAVVGIISALLGYLLGKLLGGGNNETNDLKRKNETLQADLKTCRTKLSLAGSGNSYTAASTSSSVASSFATGGDTDNESGGSGLTEDSFDADAAKAVFGKRIKDNDLTLVEGIGPKIQELFHNHDVTTWKALSECSVDKCQSVLDSGGTRYQIHNPGTWPMQAKMAYKGQWAELLKWQDEHDHGKA